MNKLNQNMELEDLKQHWNDIDARIKKLELENEKFRRRERDRKATTEKDKLVRHYRLLAFVCHFFSQVVNFVVKDVVSELTTAVVCLFFLIMTLIMFYLWRTLLQVDYSRMTVKEVVDSVMKHERMLHYKQLVGILLGLPTIASLLWDCHNYNESVFYGGLIGVLVGAVVGLKTYFRMKQRYRAIKEAYQADMDE